MSSIPKKRGRGPGKKNEKSEEPKPKRKRVTKAQVMENPIVGIDFGTSFSSIAFYDGSPRKTPDVIRDHYSNCFIPSVVYFNSETGDAIVGADAENEKSGPPWNLIIDSKRFLGMSYDDEFVRKYRQSSSNVMKIVEGENGMAAFLVNINDKKVIKKPEEVAAEILKYLKNMADNDLDNTVERAVICVPANANHSQKIATQEAARLAGLKVDTLVTEPTAGLIWCQRNYTKQQMRNSNVMVFDWGGGTLDIAFAEIKNNTYEVKYQDGDPFLGGRDVDEILRDKINNESPDINADRQMVCKMKLKLTAADVASHGHFRLTRSASDNFLKDIYKKIKDTISSSLKNSNWSPDEVDRVLMIGGSSKMPKVRKIICDIFGDRKVQRSPHFEEAVAKGAALHAYEVAYKGNNREIVRSDQISAENPQPEAITFETIDSKLDQILSLLRK